ncbi:MAG: hypothetical protein ACKV2Q_04405 [Planctomycetaceae bacterium]
MKLPVLDMPDDPQLIPGWLERHLKGLELGELVAELGAVHGPPDSPTTLDELCGADLPNVLEHGLTALPREHLRRMLKQPELLLELQERVLIDGGTYWESLPLEPELVAAVHQGWQRLSSNLGLSASVEHISDLFKADSVTSPNNASTLETGVTTTSLRRTRRLVFAAAAVMLTALGLWLFPKPQQQPLAWGWNRPGTFAADVTPDQYLDRFADRADEWSQRPHETREQLRADLTDFRVACRKMLDTDHTLLPDREQAELKGRCQKWLKKFEAQLVALDAGDDVAEIRKQADDTVQLLTTAIRQRFPPA